MSAFTRRLGSTVGPTLASSVRYYAKGLGKAVMTQPLFLWAQAIAFKTLITLLPLILLATGIFGLVLRQENPFETVAGFLRSFLPSAQSEPLVALVAQLQQSSGAITFVGGAAFVVTVITLFSTLRYVIGTAMGGDRHQLRGLAGGYLFDIRMVLQVGVLFLLSVGVTLGANMLSTWSVELGEAWRIDPDLLERLRSGLLGAVTLVVPYAITLGMLIQLYLFIPRPRTPFRSAFVGAATAAVLFEAAKNGFAVYAANVGNFDQYANNDAPLGGLGGVFGLILAFVFWVYLSGLILAIGAIVTRLHERRHQPRRSLLRRMIHVAARRKGKRARHQAARPGAAPTMPPALGAVIARETIAREAGDGRGASGDGADEAAAAPVEAGAAPPRGVPDPAAAPPAGREPAAPAGAEPQGRAPEPPPAPPTD